MSLAVAIQMDPLETVDIDGDSSFALALEAQGRGHGLYHYLPRQLSYRHGRIVATARPFEVRREPGNHVSFGAPEIIDLATMDVILMRQDPPFNLAYISATHLLDRIHPQTLVVNDPHHVRNAPEKLFVTQFAELMPPTLITNELEEIKAFRREYGTSSSSRSTAMAAPACSTSSPATPIWARWSSCFGPSSTSP